MQKKGNRFVQTLRLLRKAFGAHYPQIFFITVLSFVASILEGLGISAIIPIFSFVSGGSGQAADTITNVIGHLFALIGLPYTFRFLILFVGALFVARVFSLFLINTVTARIVFGYQRDMREKLLRSTLAARWPFLSHQKIGHLDQLLITNTTNASQFFGLFSTTVMILTKTLAYTAIAVNISGPIALLAICIGIVLFFAANPLFRRNKAFSVQAEELNRTLGHFVSQHLGGMKTIKALATEKNVAEAASAYFGQIRRVNLNMVVLRGFLEMGVQFAGLAFVGGVFIYMYRFTGFNFAAFAVIVYAVNQIFTQVQSAQVQFHSFSIMLPYLSKSLSYLEETETNKEEDGGVPLQDFKKALEFKKVSFQYPGREGALSDVSFVIPQGSMVGIVGPSGAGKSTIADLILRLIEPGKGVILLDGTDIRDISRSSWRQKVGYMTQDAFLLNDTIANNISFYDPAITEKECIEAAKRARVRDFIETLPQKYETYVGDRGVLLSGGERQRIALARILARKPALLVLDEATSSLDHASKRAIQESIQALRGETTILVIAHSDAIISAADEVLVFKDGRIVERAAPARLSADARSYFLSDNAKEEMERS